MSLAVRRLRGYARLVWWLSRGSAARRAATPVLIASTMSVILVLCLNSLALSPQQLADRDFGGYDHSVSFISGDPFALAAHSCGVRDQPPAPQLLCQVSTFDLVPDVLARHHQSGVTSGTSYRERVVSVGPHLPERNYELMSGRWPTSAGDVVVTPSLWEQLDRRRRFTVLSGLATFTVVGVAVDRFAQGDREMLGGPGTFASLPVASIRSGFPGFSAALDIRWSGAAPRRVVPALARVTGGSEADLADRVRSRTTTLAGGGSSLVRRFPLAALVPAWMVMLIGSVLAGFSSRRRVRLLIGRLRGVGIATAVTRWLAATSIAAVSVMAVLVGAVVGVGATMVLRRVLLPALSPQPLSPVSFAGVGALSFSPLLVALLVGTIAAAPPRLRSGLRRRRPQQTIPQSEGRLFTVAHVGALAVVAAATLVARAGFAPLDATTVDSIGVVCGGLLVLPAVAKLGVRLMRRGGLRGMLAARFVLADFPRFAAALTLVASALALPVSLGGIAATIAQTQRAAAVSFVPPGQVAIDITEFPGGQIPSAVTDLVARTTHAAEPMLVRVLDSAEFSERAGSSFGVLVVDDVAAAERLNGHRLRAHTRQVLSDGGVLDWSQDHGSQRLVSVDDNNVRTTTPTLPTEHQAFVAEYADSYAGIMLQATADRYRLHTYDDLLVYTSVSPAGNARLIEALRSADFDSSLVSVHTKPEPISVPPGWLIAPGILALLAAWLLAAVVVGHVRSVRRYASQLLALGLTVNWTGRIVGIQVLTLLGLAVTAGTVMGIVPVILLASGDAAEFGFPWMFALGSLGLTVVACAGGVLVALSGLTAAQRTRST